MEHSEHKAKQINHDDGGLHIIEHLMEPDSFLMVVFAAGVALVIVFIAALIFLFAVGDRVIPPGHSQARADSHTILPTTEWHAPALSAHLQVDEQPTMRL